MRTISFQRFVSRYCISPIMPHNSLHQLISTRHVGAEIKKVSGIVWTLVFQPLLPSATLHHASNSMGINTSKTLTIMHVNVVWNKASDDAVVHAAAERLLGRVEACARQRGVFCEYKYANYCSAAQNPYDGYGKERHQFLRDVSSRYDPDGIFQRGVPGHKLWI